MLRRIGAMKTSIKSGLLLGFLFAAAGVASLVTVSRSAMADDSATAPITDQDIGKDIYDTRCSTCHGPGGNGNVGEKLPLTAPPLKGDQFVISAPDRMVADVIR